MTPRRSPHRRRSSTLPSFAQQDGQAAVEYLIGTLFVVLAVTALADPSLFGINVDILAAVKDYFKAFSYVISVAAT